jgi:hypothetical protein
MLKNSSFIFSGFSLILFTVSLVNILGCDSDSKNRSAGRTALTENDFSEDLSLVAPIDLTTIVTFLESPSVDRVENDTGDIGTDVIPIILNATTNLTLCWEDDNDDAELTIALIDSEENELLFLQSNQGCVSGTVEKGNYEILFGHGGLSEEGFSIFVRPREKEDTGSRGTVSKFFQSIVSKALAQTNDLELLVTRNSCVKCVLESANLEGADLGENDLEGANLSGSNLRASNLYLADIDGADLTDADLSGAIWTDGATCGEGSIGLCATGSSHQINFMNKCQKSIWIGSVFGSPAQPYLPVNGGPPLWGPSNSPSWEVPAGQSRALEVPFGWVNGQFSFRTGCTGSGATLKCQVGGCGGFLNCGTQGKGADNSSVIEFTMDTPSGDNYNGSMVAAFHVIAEIDPSDQTCPTVGACTNELPECPWDKFVRENGQDSNFRKAGADEIGVCLAADKMVGNSAVPSDLNPFKNITPGSPDDLKLRCQCKVGGCGSPNCDGFGCSPFTPVNIIDPKQPDNHNSCIEDFGSGKPCNLSNCAPAASNYNPDQICDPYGQCSSDRMWTPEALKYIESIRTACGGFPNNKAPYAWAFDDPDLAGLSGGLATCGKSGDGINYTVTIRCQ